MIKIIAEAGVNHNGDINIAEKLIDAAAEAGADAVKFQTFEAEKLVTRDAKQASYQTDNMGETLSQYEMLKQLELTRDHFVHLKNYCDSKEIEFLSTPFDEDSVDFLVEDIGVQRIKIGSGDLTNVPFLYHIATKQIPIILSTGMAEIHEIQEALSYIAYGYAGEINMEPEEIADFYHTQEAQQLLKDYVTLLHCTTAYPTPPESVNLLSIPYLRDTFGLDTGFSDHSEGTAVPIASVSYYPAVIEKHFTLDRNLPGPDHLASLEPNELKDLVTGVRLAERAQGNYQKALTSLEKENKNPAMKSLVAKTDIKKGERLTSENMAVKRPGNGIKPNNYYKYLYAVSDSDFRKGDLLY
ncbi:N-acetylneuraminate synthase [Salibacterium qingdaonense]|uniref:N-acetylneuraminate synthase n=1 Tax=Salibacterium qingdaonense TaxID=266892 RepID=A0A1I4KZL4_9BACI|nr:N-acetylneuraminate synthase [Salibacterium qingdaonense]SFL84170.1 N-acetylneuraminate synthase [Salibacterium qingdaonense]